MNSIKNGILNEINKEKNKILVNFKNINKNVVDNFWEEFKFLVEKFNRIEILNPDINNDELIMDSKLKCQELMKPNCSLDFYADSLRKKISSIYKETPYVLKSDIKDEFFIQNGVKYLLKLLKTDHLSKKEVLIGTGKNGNISSDKNSDSTSGTNISNTTTSNPTSTPNFKDPFAPPFGPDQVIEENFGEFGTHRVFFSKFAVMAEHMLLVTREFVSQYTHLSFDDIKSALLFMRVVDGPVFFNGGKNTGASQPRKHLQSIPYKSMYDQDFGIFLLIKEKDELLCINEEVESRMINSNEKNIDNSDINYDLQFSNLFQFCKIKKFANANINHILIKFSSNLHQKFEKNLDFDNIEEYSTLVFHIYNIGLNYLNLIDDEVEILDQHYSFTLTSEWMLIIPRQTNEVPLQNGTLNINTIGYLLTILVRSENLLEELKSVNILEDVFSHL